MLQAVLDVDDCLARLRAASPASGAGDEEAARDLMRHFYPLVLRLVRSHLPRRAAEEDLCQIVFVKIFRHLGQYGGQVPLEHWIARIAVNTCLKQLAAEKARPEVRWADLGEEQARVAQTLCASPDELPSGYRQGARELLGQLLARLPPADRLVLNWLHLEDRPVAEVARLTGWTQTLVKVRAFRARQKLKRLFANLSELEKL